MLLYRARDILALALIGLALPSGAQPAPPFRALFNGKDLSGWESWLGKPHASIEMPGAARDEKGNYREPLGSARDPFNVFTVIRMDSEPSIRISGQVFGGIVTTEDFSDYHLRLQFKWGEKKWAPRDTAVRDSGLLYHMHGPWDWNGKTWPRAPELQIQERDTGDLWAIGSQMTVLARRLDPTKRLFQYDPGGGVPTAFLEEPPNGNRCIKGADHEKPLGEWNTVELITLGDEAIYVVNGVVVMRLTQARRLDGPTPVPLTTGKILLQSEGAEIFYRNIEIRPITAVPSEFAVK